MPDPDGHVGLIQVLDRVTGLMIGTISTTANVLNVQPTARGPDASRRESPKAAAQVQAELAAAQVLYPAYQAVAATVAAPPAPPAPTGPQGQPAEHPPPGGQSLNTAQQTGPVVNATGNRRCGYRRGDCHQNSGRPDTHRHAADSRPRPIRRSPRPRPLPSPRPRRPGSSRLRRRVSKSWERISPEHSFRLRT